MSSSPTAPSRGRTSRAKPLGLRSADPDPVAGPDYVALVAAVFVTAADDLEAASPDSKSLSLTLVTEVLMRIGIFGSSFFPSVLLQPDAIAISAATVGKMDQINCLPAHIKFIMVHFVELILGLIKILHRYSISKSPMLKQ